MIKYTFWRNLYWLNANLPGDAPAGLFMRVYELNVYASACDGALVLLREGVNFMSVDLRPGESQDSLLKRFRKSVAEARILPIVRQKRWFTPRSEVRRIKKQKAIRKSQRTPRE